MDRIKTENELIKRVFKGNEALLKVIRSLFFGIKLSKEQKKIIKETFADANTRNIVRKRFFAKFGDEAEIGQIADFWISVPEEKLVGASLDQIAQIIEPRKRLLEMFDVSIALLENPDGKQVDLAYDPEEDDELYITLLTRNKYMNAVEAGLNMMKMLAEAKDLTPEEQEAVNKKNSSK